MEIIITHRNADFDAFASQIAASRLYPGAIRVVSGRLSPMVHKFHSLHLDHFELTPVKEINFSEVTRVIIVDVRQISRLQDFKPLFSRLEKGDNSLEVHIYDHHIGTSDDLLGHKVQIEALGAATTILVEKLRQQKIALNSIEATALALGIYSDTGSMTYATTTARDVEATAFLLQQGANLNNIRYFLHAPMSPKQRQILATILNESNCKEINEIKLNMVAIPLEKPVSGLSEVVNEAMMLRGDEGIFAFFPKGKKVTIIGRSWHPKLDMGTILKKLGGGGHHGAGSATLKDATVTDAKQQILNILQTDPPEPHRVRASMNTPVYTVKPDQILDDVADIFQTKEISGAPVIKKDKIIGILSKRDIRAAKRANRAHLPVSSCMSHSVKTIEPDKSLLRAFERMADESVGRLPVVENEKLIGIITRNDILRQVYNIG